tara:strand:+ start:267 stop:848 length:582 start_codon:yes stop_codon:yes gene_type:complete
MDKAQFEAIQTLLGKKKKLLDTTDQVHSEAYDQTVRELLMDANDQVDFSKLDDIKMQEKFAEILKAKYLIAAKKSLEVTGGKGELEDEMLLNAYIGATSATLKAQISDAGSGYNKKAHSDIAANLRRDQDRDLTGVVYKNLKETDISDAVKHMDAEDIVNVSKLDRAITIGLMEQHYSTGLTKKMVKGKHYAK